MNSQLLYNNELNILFNIYFLIVLLLLNIILLIFLLAFKKYSKNYHNILIIGNKNFIKFISIFLYLINYFFLLYTIILFFYFNNLINLNNKIFYDFYYTNLLFYYFPLFSSNFSIDLFGILILFLAYSIGFLCLIALSNKYYNDNDYFYLYFFIFLLVVGILVTTSNIILWVVMYECLLLPSFFIVYLASSSRRSIQASLYFVIFTQIGSFIVICVVAYIISLTNVYTFNKLTTIAFTNNQYFFIYLFLFIGFGIKIPIWPFHFWLTKTHVEASAGFSMYLSGFLVKVAALGFYKFSVSLGGYVDNSIFIVICIMGILDASSKLFCQTDLKKLVAYCTILEMNLIYITLIWGDSQIFFGAIYFIYTHAFLSALMFFLVDCVQKRFGSRNVTAVSGILHVTPTLGCCIFLMIVIFSGIPGTMKFVSEICILSIFFNYSPFFTILIIFFVNFLALIGFSKSWFNSLFGMSIKFAKANIIDLNFSELLIIFICFFFLIFSIFLQI